MALITASEARGFIPGLTGTGEDTLIALFISRFDSLAASYCGFPVNNTGTHSMESKQYIEFLDGPGGRELRLPVRPIISVASLIDDPDLEYDDSTEIIPDSQYTRYDREGLIILKDDAEKSPFSSAKRAIRIDYTAGYSTVPEGIKHACGIQVANWFSSRNSIGKTKVSQGGGSADMQGFSLLDSVKESLQPYRLATSWVG